MVATFSGAGDGTRPREYKLGKPEPRWVYYTRLTCPFLCLPNFIRLDTGNYTGKLRSFSNVQNWIPKTRTPPLCGGVWSLKMERAMGIEPTLAAWEAAVLPMNYARKVLKL